MRTGIILPCTGMDVIMTHPEIKQAEEFVLEAAGWTYERERHHPFLKVWKSPEGVVELGIPPITRAMIKSLLEKVDDKGERVRNKEAFDNKILEIIFGQSEYDHTLDWTMISDIALCELNDLIMAFYLAYKEG